MGQRHQEERLHRAVGQEGKELEEEVERRNEEEEAEMVRQAKSRNEEEEEGRGQQGSSQAACWPPAEGQTEPPHLVLEETTDHS